ncbi:MAG: GNAT family N-acetyltransferase, partial [Dehalococcoidia bacterium]|nr:GNAT family N-acetyltransferase [Dehalococcoidia bacterium]
MAGETPVTYPSQYETEVLLKDGSKIRLRPIRKDDAKRWLGFMSRLGASARYLRFRHIPEQVSLEDAVRFCTVDYTNSFAFVAEVLRDQRSDIVAVGRYYRLPGRSSAEITMAIEDTFQRKGIGTQLVEWLANVARENDITTFEADILIENKQMMSLLMSYGFHVTSELEAGVSHVSFSIVRTRRTVRKEEERERISTVASIRSILFPHSVAVIGASRKPGSIGHLLMRCIMQSGFSGVVYPVNPNTAAVMSVKAYSSVLDIPDGVDMALIAVPAPLAGKVADECGRKGVRSLVVISDGFRERGPEG